MTISENLITCGTGLIFISITLDCFIITTTMFNGKK